MARFFFAFWPDPETREQIAARAATVALGGDAYAVPAESYHMTVAFVGALPLRHLLELRQLGGGLRGASCTIRFDAFEYWPKPQVVVAAAREIPSSLHDLWRELHRELAARRWAPDPKRLRPHVTLARKMAQAPELPEMSPFFWSARNVCLARSDIGGSSAAYTVLDTWPLLYEATND